MAEYCGLCYKKLGFFDSHHVTDEDIPVCGWCYPYIEELLELADGGFEEYPEYRRKFVEKFNDSEELPHILDYIDNIYKENSDED